MGSTKTHTVQQPGQMRGHMAQPGSIGPTMRHGTNQDIRGNQGLWDQPEYMDQPGYKGLIRAHDINYSRTHGSSQGAWDQTG